MHILSAPFAPGINPMRGKRGDSALPQPSQTGLRSLPLFPLQAARGVSMGRADLPWRVYWMDEPRRDRKASVFTPANPDPPLESQAWLKNKRFV